MSKARSTDALGERRKCEKPGSVAAAAGALGVAGLALARVAAAVAGEGARLDVLRLGDLHPAGRHGPREADPELSTAGRRGVPAACRVGAEGQKGRDAVDAAAVRGRGERREATRFPR